MVHQVSLLACRGRPKASFTYKQQQSNEQQSRRDPQYRQLWVLAAQGTALAGNWSFGIKIHPQPPVTCTSRLNRVRDQACLYKPWGQPSP